MKKFAHLAVGSLFALSIAGMAAPANADDSSLAKQDAYTKAKLAVPHCNGTVNVRESEWELWIPAFNGNINCILMRGDRGRAVENLQNSLDRCHHLDTGGIDGDYGPKTEAAIRAIGEGDGIYGPHARGAMRWVSHNYQTGRTVCTGV